MPEVEARYDYVDEGGTLLYQVERLKPKGFRQRCPDNGGWAYQLGETRRVPYRLPLVLAAIEADVWVTVVEGEKDVHSLEAHDRVATTFPGGAGKWRPEYLDLFKGAKVAVVADADGPGRRHALQVASALDSVVAKVLVYEPAAPHKDVTEMLEAGLTLKDLVPFDWRLEAASRVPANQNGHTPIRVMSIKELMETPDLNEEDMLLDSLVLRGSRVIVGAYTGEGKTTFSLQILSAILRGNGFLSWAGSGNGTRALVLDAEQGRRTVKRRFIEAGLHEFSEKVELVHVPDGLALDSDTRHVAEIEAILDGGHYDVVVADPLYKLHRGEANEERRAVDLMRRLDYWRERFGFALLLPMHCRKPQAGMKFSIHDLMGSSAYGFGAEVICGLQRKSNGYSFLHWWKDREGDLGCLNERWGLLFDQERGFRRDPKDVERSPTRDIVRNALVETPGMTIEQLREVSGAKQATIRRALEDIGATDDGSRLVAERHYRMQPTLFDGEEATDERVDAVA